MRFDPDWRDYSRGDQNIWQDCTRLNVDEIVVCYWLRGKPRRWYVWAPDIREEEFGPYETEGIAKTMYELIS